MAAPVPPLATVSAVLKVTVPVAVRFAVLRLLENSPFPCTENRAPGVVVPMPHLPAAVITDVSTGVAEVP